MKNNMKQIEQTGFLYKLQETDFITGSSPLVIPDVNTMADWRDFLPEGEKQYKYATFDTMSCTTFSALNIIEIWVKWHKSKGNFTKKQIETLNSLGFFADGSLNASDRFTAIMSGTMVNGNYFQNVLDSIRKDGLLPEVLLPFGGNSWSEYHNKSIITQDMKDKAKKILEILDISYEWTSIENINNDLKKCPIQGAIPFDASHAIAIPAPGVYFDSYEPHIKTLPTVRYAMKIIVGVKKEIEPVLSHTYKYFNPKSDPKMVGVKHETMVRLDALRADLELYKKYFSPVMIISSGVRTKKENDQLKDSASNSGHLRGWEVDILCTDSSKRDKMIELSYKHGFTRRGMGKDFVHLGLDPSLPQNVMWNYYK